MKITKSLNTYLDLMTDIWFCFDLVFSPLHESEINIK